MTNPDLYYDTRENGLPKWTKSILTGLRRVIAEKSAALEEQAFDPETTKVVTGYYGDYPKAVDGGVDRNVTFFPRRYDGHDKFEVRLDGDELLIYCSDSISLHMSSGNVVRVAIKDGLVEDEQATRREARAKGWTVDEIRQGKHLGHIPERDSILPPRKIVAKNTRTGEDFTAEELEVYKRHHYRDVVDVEMVETLAEPSIEKPKGFGQ